MIGKAIDIRSTNGLNDTKKTSTLFFLHDKLSIEGNFYFSNCDATK